MRSSAKATGRSNRFPTGGATARVRAGEGFIEGPRAAHRMRNPDKVSPVRFVLAGTFRKGEAAFQFLAEGARGPWPAEEAGRSEPAANGGANAPLTQVKRTLESLKQVLD